MGIPRNSVRFRNYNFYCECIMPRSIVPATGYCRNRPERCGKITVSRRKTREVAGTWKQYSGRKIFGVFPYDSLSDPAGKHWKLTAIHRKKIREFPAGILLPPSSDFPCFPVVSRRTATTCVVVAKQNFHYVT